MNPILITIDVETPQTPLFTKKLNINLFGKTGGGLEEIVKILNHYNLQATFFVNVYEYKLWGKREIQRIIRFLYENKQDIQLHTHPIWIDSKRREFMFEYNLEEQKRIIDFGKKFIEDSVGRKVNAHRAGGYGLDENTLIACAENGIEIDSSVFFGHRNCKFIASESEIKKIFGIIEIPIQRLVINGRETKLDIDWMSIDEILSFQKENSDKSSHLMMHSYSLLCSSEDKSQYTVDEKKAKKLTEVLRTYRLKTPVEEKRYSFTIKKVNKQIIFVKKHPQIRVFKEAYAIKKMFPDYELILMAEKIDYSLFSGTFDKILQFNDISSLRGMVKQFSPLVFHTHAEPNTIPAAVVEESSVPVIYDVYDFSGIRYGIEKLNPTECENEKYALENCTAIVFKFKPSILNYYREHGYKIDKPVFTYLDYCIPDYFNWDFPGTNNLTLVYTGVLNSSKYPRNKYGNNQYIEFIKKIAPQGIGYELFVNKWQMENMNEYSDYIQLSEIFPKVKFHAALSQPELQKAISKFSYGISFHDFSFTDHHPLFEKTSIGNKLSTYLEAGLPVLTSANLEYNSEVVEQFNVGMRINLAELNSLKEILLNIDYGKMKENVKSVREKDFNAFNNVHRLINIYKSINNG